MYFPVSRFEDPAWLNVDNLKRRAAYEDRKNIIGYTEREAICLSPLKNNVNWVLDVLLDREIYDRVVKQIKIESNSGSFLPAFLGYKGQASSIHEAINEIVRMVLRSSGGMRIGVGPRNNRQISVMQGGEIVVPNLFQLSSGETSLLNIFMSILRDYDYTGNPFSQISNIKGIVIVDEIDAHLHTFLQYEVLPRMILAFPYVQFIMTSHSPLFLLGMKQLFGDNGFVIYDMKSGSRICADEFSEFEEAYRAYSETERYKNELQRAIDDGLVPLVFVEGDYDIRYIQKAAEMLGKEKLLSRFKLNDGGGYGNLDKIWKNCDSRLSAVILNKVLLLYDCDIRRCDEARGKISRRVIPHNEAGPIEIGIENLFSEETVSKLETASSKFIDVDSATTKRIRGNDISVPEKKSVNKDEKKNICDWLCLHGTKDDFLPFDSVFSVIETFLES